MFNSLFIEFLLDAIICNEALASRFKFQPGSATIPRKISPDQYGFARRLNPRSECDHKTSEEEIDSLFIVAAISRNY